MVPTRPSGETGNLYDFEVRVLGVDNREDIDDCKTENHCCYPFDSVVSDISKPDNGDADK